MWESTITDICPYYVPSIAVNVDDLIADILSVDLNVPCVWNNDALSSMDRSELEQIFQIGYDKVMN